MHRAARPKERKRHNSKCTELTKQLAQGVQQYNALVQALRRHDPNAPFNVTSIEEVKQQHFRWLQERVVAGLVAHHWRGGQQRRGRRRGGQQRRRQQQRGWWRRVR
jgi:uncharacterized short protein YbdD (DUF466 family)